MNYFVVHGPQLLPEPSLHIAAEFRRLRIGLFVPGSRGFHWILLSHGLSFVHNSTPTSEARGGHRLPLGFSQNL